MVSVFQDESSGAKIEMHLFYGFGDSGSIAGRFSGYATRELATANIVAEWTDMDIGSTPGDLGMYAVTVLSGQEFVDELTKRGILHECGYWIAT
jgi:hypothetical protein